MEIKNVKVTYNAKEELNPYEITFDWDAPDNATEEELEQLLNESLKGIPNLKELMDKAKAEAEAESK